LVVEYLDAHGRCGPVCFGLGMVVHVVFLLLISNVAFHRVSGSLFGLGRDGGFSLVSIPLA